MIKYLNFPAHQPCFILKNKKYLIFFKNKNFYFFLYIMYILKKNNYFYLLKKNKTNYNLNLYFFSWNNYIIKKIKFKHKISWVYIYRKNLQLFKISTNLSHFNFLIVNEIHFRRRKKHLSMHTITIWGLDTTYLNFILNKIILSLALNPYTQRGFKLARGKVIKRIGKVSKYSSLKSKVF